MEIIYITCYNKKEAEKIIKTLIKARLIGCATMWPIESFYRWKKGIEKSKEVAVLAKAPQGNFKEIESLVLGLHSYEVPLITSWQASRVNREYIDWLRESC